MSERLRFLLRVILVHKPTSMLTAEPISNSVRLFSPPSEYALLPNTGGHLGGGVGSKR